MSLHIEIIKRPNHYPLFEVRIEVDGGKDEIGHYFYEDLCEFWADGDYWSKLFAELKETE